MRYFSRQRRRAALLFFCQSFVETFAAKRLVDILLAEDYELFAFAETV
jgi:hypothetical protein